MHGGCSGGCCCVVDVGGMKEGGEVTGRERVREEEEMMKVAARVCNPRKQLGLSP